VEYLQFSKLNAEPLSDSHASHLDLYFRVDNGDIFARHKGGVFKGALVMAPQIKSDQIPDWTFDPGTQYDVVDLDDFVPEHFSDPVSRTSFKSLAYGVR
jgi:hypothetical protein